MVAVRVGSRTTRFVPSIQRTSIDSTRSESLSPKCSVVECCPISVSPVTTRSTFPSRPRSALTAERLSNSSATPSRNATLTNPSPRRLMSRWFF
jgi:hypothetical protein